MTRARRRSLCRVACGALFPWVVFVASCEESAPPACDDPDGCIGVPEGPLCDGDFCSDGVACGEVIEVASAGDLGSALDDAGSGDCIALGPGTYGAIDLPGGVSLLGRGAAFVEVESIRLGAGRGSWVRGLTVTAGIDAGSATASRVDAVLATGGAIGIRAGAGADLSVTRSELRGSTKVGLYIEGAANVAFSSSLVSASLGPGIWSQCESPTTDACDCPSQPTVLLEHVVLEQPVYAAVHFAGTTAIMNDVRIEDVQPLGDSIQKPGGGVSVTACSSLTYREVEIDGAGSYGMLVDHASVAPSSGIEEHGIIIIDTKPGLWVRNTDAATPVTLDRVEVQSCRGTGIGIDLGATGIIIIDTRIADTILETAPVVGPDGETPGIAQIGLGLAWRAGASVQIDGLTAQGNATQGVLIDGAVGPQSSIANVTLGPGDDTDGVVQQQVSSPSEAPAASGVTVNQITGQVSDVPLGPEVPGL